MKNRFIMLCGMTALVVMPMAALHAADTPPEKPNSEQRTLAGLKPNIIVILTDDQGHGDPDPEFRPARES